MIVFIVILDIGISRSDTDSEYENLYNKLKSMDHYKLAKNCWFVSYDGSLPEAGRELRNTLRNHMHPSDHIHLFPVTDYYNYAEYPIRAWLWERMPRRVHPSDEEKQV